MARKKRVPFNQNCDENLYEEFKSYAESHIGSIAEHLESALRLYLDFNRDNKGLADGAVKATQGVLESKKAPRKKSSRGKIA